MERSEMRGRTLQKLPGCRFAYPGYELDRYVPNMLKRSARRQ